MASQDRGIHSFKECVPEGSDYFKQTMNEEDDEAEGSRRSLPSKQINISIQLSFHYIILLCICLYSVVVLCMIGCLH